MTNSHYRTCVDAGARDPPALVGSYQRDPYYGNGIYGDYPLNGHAVGAYWEALACHFCQPFYPYGPLGGHPQSFRRASGRNTAAWYRMRP